MDTEAYSRRPMITLDVINADEHGCLQCLCNNDPESEGFHLFSVKFRKYTDMIKDTTIRQREEAHQFYRCGRCGRVVHAPSLVVVAIAPTYYSDRYRFENAQCINQDCSGRIDEFGNCNRCSYGPA